MYIIWIEGIGYKKGEKIKTLTSTDHTYTTKMTEALRVKPKDLHIAIGLLRAQGVSDWVLENDDSYIRTRYTPKGTNFNPKDLEL